MAQYQLNISNAASLFVAELQSAMTSAKTAMRNIELECQASDKSLLWNSEYEARVVWFNCYKEILRAANICLTKDPFNGPAADDTERFVNYLKNNIRVTNPKTKDPLGRDYRIGIWNKVIDDIISDWISYNVMTKGPLINEISIIEKHLIPIGLASIVDK